MMLLKCCTQHDRKFGKLSSGHKTGKGQFSFQPQRRAIQNYHTIAFISHASKVMLKTLQARFQQYVNQELSDIQADLEKIEEPEIKLPTSVGSSKKQESSRKTSTSALLRMLKPLTVWFTANCWKFLEMGILDHLTCLLINLYAGQEATVRAGHGTGSKLEKECQVCILSVCLLNLYEMLGWVKLKLESRVLEEISITLCMQLTSP